MKSSMPPTRQPWSLALFFLNSLLNILISMGFSKCKNTPNRRNKRKFGAEKAFKPLELRWFRRFVSSIGKGRPAMREPSRLCPEGLRLRSVYPSDIFGYQVYTSRHKPCLLAERRCYGIQGGLLSFGARRYEGYL